MEIRINRDAFLKGLYLAQGVADRKGPSPTIANVLVRTEGPEAVLCAATDLRTSVVSEIAATVEQEGGISVAAKQLYEIVRNLPDREVHVRKTDNNWTEIKSGRSQYKLVGMPARDFPKLPDHRELEFKEFDAATLADMISKTIFSVSTDETRHHLCGIFFECDGKTAVMVSTDGHRLSKVEREVGDGPVLDSGVILPRKGVFEIKRLLESVSGTCDIGFSEGHVFVKAGDVVLSVALVDARFPPYQQVIPNQNDKSLLLDRLPLLESLKRASIMSSERSWGIRVELSPGRLRLTSDNPDLGEAQEDLEVSYEGEELTIGFNARYFIDVINEIKDDRICLEFNGELDPGLVRAEGSKDYIGVVMPMRI